MDRKYDGDKPAWLDAKKTRQEPKPSRVVHRVHEVFQNYESKKPESVNLEKDLMGKKIKRNGVAIGATL